jgi:iron(III) transport system permease protein
MTLFLTSKRVLASKSYATIARGHTAGAEIHASRGQTALIWAAGTALMLVALTPHLTVIVSSLADRWFFTVLPESWTTGHFGDVFGHGLTASSIRNSLFYASLSAFVDLILGVLIAWLLTRKKIPFAGVLDALAMLPLALPGLVLAFGYFAGFDVAEKQHPWLDSFLDPRTNPTFLLIVSYSVRRLPYIVRSAYAGFQQTSVTLEEASANLGASPLRTLRKIEFGESDDIQITREYSVVQRRFIYRAEYKTHRHTLGHASGAAGRALRRRPSDRERVEVKVVVCD